MFRDLLLNTLFGDLAVTKTPEFDNLKELDLRKDEDYEKFKESIETLKKNPIFNVLGSLIGVDSHMLDEVVEEVDIIREQQKEEEEKNIKITRPSETIPTNVGLQIHKLVQEYIDTMVKPYATGIMDDKEINDAYAGLYEFACWIHQHK